MAASKITDRNRMHIKTFQKNFPPKVRATYLCYEVKEGADCVTEKKRMNFLRNQGKYTKYPKHAEVLFLKRVSSWNLDPKVPWRITCFISWSPCPECAAVLKTFLEENPQVKLDIHAAKIYEKLPKFELGLQALRAAGAQISIMTKADYEHCWINFVKNKGKDFDPGTISDGNISCETRKLKKIFRESFVLPPQSPALSSEVTQDDKKDDPETLLTEETSKE